MSADFTIDKFERGCKQILETFIEPQIEHDKAAKQALMNVFNSKEFHEFFVKNLNEAFERLDNIKGESND